MDSKDYMNVILDLTALAARLDAELTKEQEARRVDIEQLHAQYGQKIKNLMDKLPGDGKGGTDVSAQSD